MLFTGLLLTLLAGAPQSSEVYVSSQRGDDETATGTKEAPFRTITRGLSAAHSLRARQLVVEFGVYHDGETFPLQVWGGLELRGIGAAGTTIQGGPDDVLVRVVPSPDGEGRPATLSALGLAGGGLGLEYSTPSVPLRLNGVVCEGLPVGVRLDATETAAPPLSVVASGFRAVDCAVGLEGVGEGELRLDLGLSSFERCEVGLLFRAAEDVEPDAYEGAGVHHTVRVRDSVFQGCSLAGILRRGAARTNRGAPYRFQRTLFHGNRVGLELQRPAADSAMDVLDCRFLANTHFGLRVCGHRGDRGLRSRIEGCEFRWNGVGLHTTNTHVLYEVRRNRFVDNSGNAIFMSNFMTDPVRVLIANNLVAGNGGAGVYCMADGQQLAAEILHNTVVHNGGGGVYRKTRHSGTSTFEVRGCIVAGNAPDLVKIEPQEVFHSLIGDGSGGEENGNLAGDPGFVDPELRDFRLAPGSRCIDRGAVDERLGEADLVGSARVVGAPDLGALEAAEAGR
ncbi:MAG: right-handed parallel beta-helix repeat-containing protein [Planctomycetota bacterium]